MFDRQIQLRSCPKYKTWSCFNVGSGIMWISCRGSVVRSHQIAGPTEEMLDRACNAHGLGSLGSALVAGFFLCLK